MQACKERYFICNTHIYPGKPDRFISQHPVEPSVNKRVQGWLKDKFKCNGRNNTIKRERVPEEA